MMKSIKEKLTTTFLLLLLLLGLPVIVFAAGQKDQCQDRPNIVVILVDDMGFSDLGCYGGEIDTPNINKLAAGGLRYTQCYNTSRCCPTRASLLTGLYPHKAGMGFMSNIDAGKPGYRGDLNRQCVTIAEALGSQGYATYMAGKWHICRNLLPEKSKHNWPCQRGFDRFFGTITGVGSYWDPITLTEQNEPISPQGDFYYQEAITEKAVSYIRENPKDKPFFCYVAYTAPHFPLHARAEVIEKYRGRFAKGWDQLREERRRRLVQLGIVSPDWKLPPRDPSVKAWEEAENRDWQQSRMEAYAAAIDHVDQGVGAIVDSLAQTGQLDNTIILFLSDNGGEAVEHPKGEIGSTGEPWILMRYVPMFTRQGEPVIYGDIPGVRPGPATTYAGCGAAWANLSNTPFRRFKIFAHEGGISTPLIVHWPQGIHAAGELRKQPVHVIDFLPTFLDLAAADYPTTYKGETIKPLDGISIVPTFEDNALPQRPLFWEHRGNRAVRDGRWKLVATNDAPWELYDIHDDRTETCNLADQKPEIVNRLRELYENWARDADVFLWKDLEIPFIPPADNPLTRTPEELEEYFNKIKQ